MNNICDDLQYEKCKSNFKQIQGYIYLYIKFQLNNFCNDLHYEKCKSNFKWCLINNGHKNEKKKISFFVYVMGVKQIQSYKIFIYYLSIK